MNFGRAFSFVFEDKDWFRKIAIIGLVGLIPIIGQMIVFGWGLKISKQVMNRESEVLPELDFTGDLIRGFMGFVITFVYFLPIFLISAFFSIIGSGLSFTGNDSAISTGFSVASLCFSLFSLLYGLAAGIVYPAAITRYLEKDHLSDAFDFSAVFKMVQLHLGNYFIVLVGTFVASLVGSLGVIACVIGVILTYTYSFAVIGHFYGQAHREASKPPMVVDVPPTA